MALRAVFGGAPTEHVVLTPQETSTKPLYDMRHPPRMDLVHTAPDMLTP